MHSLRTALFACLLAVAVLPLQAQDTKPKHDAHHTAMTDTSNTVISVARGQGSFMTLLKAIDTAGLTETLMGKGPFTVFAPTDDAFGKLEDGAVEDLLKPGNRDLLKALLGYHVIQGERFTASDLQSRANVLNYELQTMGGLLAISSAETGIFIGGAAIAVPDVKAGNGIIHVMGSVITPPSMNDQFNNN